MGKAVFRAMTDVEARAALALGACSFCPGSVPKRIARDLSAQVEKKRITERQASVLWKLVWSYRRQITDAEVLAIATSMHKGEPVAVPAKPQGELPW